MAELRLSLLASDPNIVGYWRYEANSNGTVGPNGTDTNMSYTAGKFGNAATFNGSSSKIVYSFTQPTSAYSIVAWIKPNLSVADTNYRIYDSQDSGSPSTGVVFVLNPSLSGSTVNLRVYHNNGAWSTSSNLSNINDNAYHHIAVTWDGSTHKFYVDGVAQGTPSYSTAVTNSGFLDIGHGRATGTFWNGQIDDVGVFSRVLTLAEIQTLYNDPTAKSVSDSGTGSESQAITNSLTRTDSGTGSDAKAITVTVPTRTDSGSGSDVKSITVSQTRTDIGSGSDSVSVPLLPIIADVATGNDVFAGIMASVPLSETGSGSDVIAAFLSLVPLSDDGDGSESIAIHNTIATLNETGTGIDAIMIAAQIAQSDSASANDALKFLIMVAASDAAEATEAVIAINHVAQSDAATANDAVVASIVLSIVDSGSSSDAVSLLNRIVAQDNGAAVDSALLVIIRAVLDQGVADEDIAPISEYLTILESGHGVDTAQALDRLFPYTRRKSPYHKLREV